MNLIFHGKNIPVTAALKNYTEKRLGKLEKLVGDLGDVQATFSVERGRHRVEVTIPFNGLILRGEEETGDMYGSLDLIADKLERQIQKYKTRLLNRNRSRSIMSEKALATAGMEEDQEPTEWEELVVARTKKIPVKPMPLDEAIMQMNLLCHSFFVFSNAQTEKVNVVYRRRDGTYGLIEPE